jgi:hypothetical protein
MARILLVRTSFGCEQERRAATVVCQINASTNAEQVLDHLTATV